MGLFDDLIIEKERKKAKFECWDCECNDFDYNGLGIFISSIKLKQRVICKSCGKKYIIIYDNNLYVIDFYPED